MHFHEKPRLPSNRYENRQTTTCISSERSEKPSVNLFGRRDRRPVGVGYRFIKTSHWNGGRNVQVNDLSFLLQSHTARSMPSWFHAGCWTRSCGKSAAVLRRGKELRHQQLHQSASSSTGSSAGQELRAEMLFWYMRHNGVRKTGARCWPLCLVSISSIGRRLDRNWFEWHPVRASLF